MTLIKSISGIRGIIGGVPGFNLTPADVVKFSAAYGTWLKSRSGSDTPSVVIGRDARVSGQMIDQLVTGTLIGLGFDIVHLGLSSTPAVEMAVTRNRANGGIIITASHNPVEWNALKLLNQEGEFVSASDGEEILSIAESERFTFADVKSIGNITFQDDADQYHIDQIIQLEHINIERIKQVNFFVAVDGINSVGGLVVPKLLKQLGVERIFELNCTPDGNFNHNPEPIPENLTDVSSFVVEKQADIGIVVDPDVDRLAIICEDGSMFGEEYTLVAVADYVLKKTPGNTVSNLSSTQALKDITSKYGKDYHASAVGEVNIVEKMKETKAVIGGEGNGGVIFPELHYGRDALVAIALFLSHLAESGITCSELRKRYPHYHMIKNKVELKDGTDFAEILNQIKMEYKNDNMNEEDGLRIDGKEGWIHLRKSNTEPLIRIIAESNTRSVAEKYISRITSIIQSSG